MNRISRNFWALVAATVLAAGLLSTGASMPPSPFAGVLTAVAATAAVTSLALAGRILVVVSRSRTGAGTGRRRQRRARLPVSPGLRPTVWRRRT